MERDIIAIKEELRSIKKLLEKLVDSKQNNQPFLKEILNHDGDCFSMDCDKCPLCNDTKSPCSNCRGFFLDVEKTRRELCKYIKTNYLKEE